MTNTAYGRLLTDRINQITSMIKPEKSLRKKIMYNEIKQRLLQELTRENRKEAAQ